MSRKTTTTRRTASLDRMREGRSQRRPTRERLMESALQLVGQGRGFGSLGLREVTREAGVVPDARVSVTVQRGAVIISVAGHEDFELPDEMAHAVFVEAV